MQALAVIPGEKYSAHLREMPTPEISDDEVLVRSVRAGVCGTDREIHEGLYGTAPFGKEYLILGHESCGIVEKMGKNVVGLSIGQHVVRTVRRPCPRCENCNHGSNDMCSTGKFTESGIKELDGCMAEYFKDKSHYLIPIPAELGEVSVLLEPLSVVEKALRQAYKLQQRLVWNPRTALVIGAGPIGLLQAMLLVEQGWDVSVLARSPPGNSKSKIVADIGATYLSASASSSSLEQRISTLGNIDFIVEASGDSQRAFDAMRWAGNNGVVCLTSITPGKKELSISGDAINLNAVLGNKVFFGTVNAHRTDYYQGVQSLRRFMERWPGVLPRMLNHKIPLMHYEQALQPSSHDIKVTIEIS
ncbi:MAG: glucose 1-dehydrogenase [Nanoarchaeota archaeon]|nr:glucose 1-dehydrogenase [Nanoarchaeota archaeon]